MEYYFVDTMGDLEEDLDWGVVDLPPDDLGSAFILPARGERVGAEYPADARVHLSRKYPGMRIGSLIGNTLGYLMLAGPVKAAIEELCPDVEIEYLPFTLYNNKNRVHASDYFIVNPIGARDCLNMEASEVVYLDDPDTPEHGELVEVLTFILDPGKLTGAPALFRVQEAPRNYVVDESLADAFRKHAFTNILLTRIEQRPRASASAS